MGYELTKAGQLVGLIAWVLIVAYSSTQANCIKFQSCGAFDIFLFAAIGVGMLAPAWIVAVIASELWKKEK